MIVERPVLRQLPNVPLPSLMPFNNLSRLVTVSWSLLANSWSLASLPSAPLPALMLATSSIGVGHRLVQVVVQAVVLQELAGRAFAFIQRGGDFAQPIDRCIQLLVKRVVVNQLPSVPSPLAIVCVMVAKLEVTCVSLL